jgi:hypothetical protein
VDKDMVNHWLPIVGRHGQGVMNYFFRNLHLGECQLDELWTFIYKKERQLTPLEKLAEVYGDAWVWIAFSPVCKLVPAWVVGKRTSPHARRLVFRLKSATDGQIPFFTSDELPHYADALLDVYGEWVQPPRNGTRGRFPPESADGLAGIRRCPRNRVNPNDREWKDSQPMYRQQSRGRTSGQSTHGSRRLPATGGQVACADQLAPEEVMTLPLRP